MKKTPIIQQLLSLLKTAPTKEQALHQMSTLFEQDEALTNTLVAALLLLTLESQEIYPLLELKPPEMVDMQILAYFSAASWHGVAKSVVRDRLTQQEPPQYFQLPGCGSIFHIAVTIVNEGKSVERALPLLRRTTLPVAKKHSCLGAIDRCAS